MNKKILAVTAAVFLLLIPGSLLSAQDEGGLDFGMNWELGVETFTENNTEVAYQAMTFQPEIIVGKLGVALDLVFHFRFEGEGETPSQFQFRTADWTADDPQEALSLYLSKITYVRWGEKNDPLYAKLGEIEDGTLGTGFMMSNYSNTLFKPDQKKFGLALNMDGTLFDFPYVGFESLVGDIAYFDVIGSRLFVRPLAWSQLPILNALEIGGSVYIDRDPDRDPTYFDPFFASVPTAEPVTMGGFDFIQPILGLPFLSLAGYGDLVFQNNATGGMLGIGGKALGFLPYFFQLRFLGDNFIPAYFDTTYDIYRGAKYSVYQSTSTVVPGSVGWVAGTGLSFLEDAIMFNVSMNGPFAPIPTGSKADNAPSEYPHLKASFILEKGLLPFYFEGVYEKQYIASVNDLLSPQDALIQAALHYQTGAAVITMTYDIIYNPDTTDFEVQSSLSCSVELF